MKQHLFDYKPGSRKILCRKYLCDCTHACNLILTSTSVPPVESACHKDECNLDVDNNDENRKILEFATLPSFVALVSEDSNESVYILKVEEKGKADKEEADEYGHIIAAEEYFIITWEVFENGKI